MSTELSRTNPLAYKGERSGKYFRISWGDALEMLKRGETVYEKVLPACSTNRAERAAIPWTPVNLDDHAAPGGSQR